jgi:hypothetical protein
LTGHEGKYTPQVVHFEGGESVKIGERIVVVLPDLGRPKNLHETLQ